MTAQITIFNGRVIAGDRLIENGYVTLSDGAITEIGTGRPDLKGAQDIDAQGNYISPGFIDLHVHGGGGADFMDGSVEAFLTVAETHAKYGTTAMCPTTLTSEIDELLHTLDLYELANTQNDKGAQFLGMHLEGPYFNVNQRGAQDERYIRNPDPLEYERILAHSNSIVRWSAAPELPGALQFGKRIKEKGILLALAHTDAVYEEVVKGYEVGYNLATHFYSAMSGVTRKNAFRHAGVIETCYLIDDMDVELIADGIHLPSPLLQLVYKIKGTGRTALITDAMRGAGMPEGESVLGNLETGLKVIVEDGVAKLMDRSSFAGSVATADRLVRTMVSEGKVPLVEAISMISATPARILGIHDSKGTITVGKDADIVVFDENIDIKLTIVKGRAVYQKP